MTNNAFYIYAYLRATDTQNGRAGSPYYVGKGKGRRAYSRRGKHSFPAPKEQSQIVILKDGLTEAQAFAEEIHLIAQYGRVDLGTGCLHNRTNGGEGLSGHLQTLETRSKRSLALIGRKRAPFSAQHLANMSAAMIGRRKGRKLSIETRAKMSAAARNMSPEHKAKISAANLGRHFSLEHRAKLAAAKLGRKQSAEHIAKRFAAHRRAATNTN